MHVRCKCFLIICGMGLLVCAISETPENVTTGNTECGVQRTGLSAGKIYGGTETQLGEFPWMVLLNYNRINRFDCSGALINERYVLTAAHCLIGEINRVIGHLTFVRLGEHDLSQNPDCFQKTCAPKVLDIPVEKIIPHPGYDPSSAQFYHDIGLIRLSQSVKYTDYIRPICLPKNELNDNLNIGKRLIVAGWGRTPSGSFNDVKLKVSVPLQPNEKCTKAYSTISNASIALIPEQICAGGELGKDSCRGDSGGPLMATSAPAGSWYAVGIVSYGPRPCGLKKYPSVYTNVSSYIQWIQGQIYSFIY